MSDVAGALSELNPELQKYMSDTRAETAQAEEAAGAQAEAGIDPRQQFREGKESWRSLIDSERKRDRENGTNNADRIAGASPHFRRGLMKQRLNRVGMGLNDHLMNLWRENPQIETQQGVMPLHEVDDPAALQAWVTANTAEYTSRFGVENMDPLLVGETLIPRVTAAQDGFLSRHTEFRLQRYNEDYMTEMSMNLGMVMAGGGTNASDVDSFIMRLGARESSNNWSIENDEGFFGFTQFGMDRLTDYNRATGQNITKEQFKASEKIQMEANRWHINDIDKHIQAKGYLEKGYSLDGLRAVAHLGGKGGMDDFVSKGANYRDSNGTGLMDYYNEFSGPSAEVQALLADARADGMNPTQINKALVDSMILTARQTKNPAVLGMLNEIDTGNGPVGNIGWVKEAVLNATEAIEADVYREQQRASATETAERKAASLAMKTEAYRTIITDPFAPVDELKAAALEFGDPDLAEDMIDFQKKMIDGVYDVRNNVEAITDIRIGIFSGDLTKEEAMDRIREGAGVDFDSGTMMQLMDDLARGGVAKELISDSIVQDTLADVKTVIGDVFKTSDPLGNTERGVQQAVQAERWVRSRLLTWQAENPEATLSEGRVEADRLFDLVVKNPRFQPQQSAFGGEAPERYGEVTRQADDFAEIVNMAQSGGFETPEAQSRLNEMAAQAGMTTQEYMLFYGIIQQPTP